VARGLDLAVDFRVVRGFEQGNSFEAFKHAWNVF
jgi:hypothetical protein